MLQLWGFQRPTPAELFNEMRLAVAGKFVQVQPWIQMHALDYDGFAIHNALRSTFCFCVLLLARCLKPSGPQGAVGRKGTLMVKACACLNAESVEARCFANDLAC